MEVKLAILVPIVLFGIIAIAFSSQMKDSFFKNDTYKEIIYLNTPQLCCGDEHDTNLE